VFGCRLLHAGCNGAIGFWFYGDKWRATPLLTRKWRDGRVAEGAGLLNRFPRFHFSRKNTNKTNGFNGFVRVLNFGRWHIATAF
jgi:hypothetical protein